MARRALELTAVAALFAAGAGCNPLDFDQLGDSASTRAVEAPDGYATDRFALTLAAFEGVGPSGERVSRLAAGGGLGYPVIVFAGWTGAGFDLDGGIYDVCSGRESCVDPSTGTVDYGEALVGVPEWRVGMMSAGTGCVMVTTADDGGFVMKCENNTPETISGMTAWRGRRIGQTGASLGAGNGVGVAVLGAPNDASGAGAIYRVGDGAGAEVMTLTVGTVPPGGALGSSIAAAPIDSTTALIAAGAPAASRVLVVTARADGTGEVLACIDDPSPGFGTALAIGDVDGDGRDDVIIGGVGTDGASENVRVYLGSDTPLPGCSGWGAAPLIVGCPDNARGIPCDGASFGASLATGDVDADGDDEIIVGAPLADVEGAVDAGAVYVFPGGPAGPEVGNVAVQTDSRPEANDHLGTTVAALPSGLGTGLTPRVEPVGGAPGGNQALVFLCTGLPNDSPADLGERCVPTP